MPLLGATNLCCTRIAGKEPSVEILATPDTGINARCSHVKRAAGAQVPATQGTTAPLDVTACSSRYCLMRCLHVAPPNVPGKRIHDWNQFCNFLNAVLKGVDFEQVQINSASTFRRKLFRECCCEVQASYKLSRQDLTKS